MRLLSWVVTLGVLAARPAFGGAILYATAASQDRVDGFCLGRDGALAPTPKTSLGTAGKRPRRLVVGNGVLYVAEQDRVEAFQIGERGALRRLRGATRPIRGMDPRDLALSADGKTLYVPQHGKDRVAAYPLDAEGAPQPEYTSCVQGRVLAGYLHVLVNNGLLYASAESAPGRVEVHALGADGSLKATPVQCRPATATRDRSAETPPLSERTRIQKPKSIVLLGDMLYVEERARRRIIAFQLQPDGTFCDKSKTMAETCVPPPLATPTCGKRQAKKQRQQCPASVTDRVLQYERLILEGDTLLGTQFFRGRVDAYRLLPEPRLPDSPRVRLPSRPTQTSDRDVSMTPVGAAVSEGALYVASGELDRVVAYRLGANGGFANPAPFSRTDEQKNSFPNDVAVAMLSGACE